MPPNKKVSFMQMHPNLEPLLHLLKKPRERLSEKMKPKLNCLYPLPKIYPKGEEPQKLDIVAYIYEPSA